MAFQNEHRDDLPSYNKLDTTPLIDGQYSGYIEEGIAGAALSFGECVYLAVADSRWEKVKADSTTTSIMKIGICVQDAAADGDPTLILLWGKVRKDAILPTMTIGAPVYISAATAGLLTSTAPSAAGNVIRVVGYGNTADELFLDIDKSWVKHA